MKIKVDLRSDTVTHPSLEMRKAMYEAELGDDVYGDDPTVNKLQDLAAEMLGKEAGLFVSSGTQGNLISILSQAQRGEEIILGESCHIFNNEAGGASVLGGIVMFPIKTNRHGVLGKKEIENAVKPRDYHKPPSKILCIENTHNNTSGQAITVEQTQTMALTAKKHGLKIHLDGARLFNAAVALNVDVEKLTSNVDTVTFCLSKGLACPIGSIIVGNKDFIVEAGRWRKILGSGMRQVGIVAAAGLVALTTMIDRLSEDHHNASRLAFGLSELPGIALDPHNIHTNIVRFGVPRDTGDQIASLLKDNGVHINGGSSDLRMVTHFGILDEDIDFTLTAMSKVMSDITKNN